MMLGRNILNKCERVSANLYGWSRYVILRKYSKGSNNIEIANGNFQKSPEEEHVKNLLNDAASFNEASDESWATSPYPDGAVIPPEMPERPQQDPSTSSIFLFPGQGTLKVGKAREYIHIPRAKEVFEIANAVLGLDLLKMCLKGPQAELDRTEFNQIATVVTSVAALEKVWEERPLAIEQCKASVGYSVGELTALIFSGAFSLEDGIRLAGIRGAAMQQASDSTPQGMLLVKCLPQTKLGIACEEARKWAMDMGAPNPVCKIAIYLYPETKVVAGNEEALKFLENNSKQFAIRTQRLSVSGAFHTPLMEPAIKSFKKALDKVDIALPRINTYSNVTSKPYRTVEQVKKLLLKQLIKPVKWEQIIHSIYTRPQGVNFPRTLEIGSSGSLSKTMKYINLKASSSCVTI